MPFTLAHPAAVLPLRRQLPLEALVVGSLTPDMAYFLPIGAAGATSHSLSGLVWFCVPVGLLSLVAYVFVLRPFGLAVLPNSVAQRLGPMRVRWSLRETALAAVAVVAGATTHVVWDSFTHSSGAVVRAFPSLRYKVALLDFYQPSAFTILQHTSTVGGLAVLAWLGVRWLQRAPAVRPPNNTPAWLKACVVGVVLVPSVVASTQVLLPRILSGESTFRACQEAIGQAVFAGGTAFLLALVLMAAAWRAWQASLGSGGAAQQGDEADEAQGGTRTAS